MPHDPAIWRFFDFVNSAGTNPVRKWFIKELSVQEKSDLVTLLMALQKQTKTPWDQSDYKSMSNLGERVGEIRLPGSQRIPIRLIGVRDETQLRFTFLIGCRHKDDIWIPAEARDTAKQRKKDLDNNRGTTSDTKIFDFYQETEDQ